MLFERFKKRPKLWILFFFLSGSLAGRSHSGSREATKGSTASSPTGTLVTSTPGQFLKGHPIQHHFLGRSNLVRRSFHNFLFFCRVDLTPAKDWDVFERTRFSGKTLNVVFTGV